MKDGFEGLIKDVWGVLVEWLVDGVFVLFKMFIECILFDMLGNEFWDIYLCLYC